MLTKAKENLVFAMSSLPEEIRANLSHSKDEFIKQCSFNGRQCNIDEDFKQHIDPEFGNCYTFQCTNDTHCKSTNAGPTYGIRVILFVNTFDYIPTSESAGVRVAVHGKSELPYPNTFGYSAPVGFASSFGLRKKSVQRLSAPYGDCRKEKTVDDDTYIYPAYDYNTEGCYRSCFQNNLLKQCGCGDPRYPVPKNQKHCDAFNITARECLQAAIDRIGDPSQMRSKCECRQPCDHDVFTVTFSTARYPSGATELDDCDEVAKTPNATLAECQEFYSKNAALVEVYYEQLNYELLIESEAYGWVNLLADVGGHLGLWMGFSVITVIECCELFFELTKFCFCARLIDRKKKSDEAGNDTDETNCEDVENFADNDTESIRREKAKA